MAATVTEAVQENSAVLRILKGVSRSSHTFHQSTSIQLPAPAP